MASVAVGLGDGVSLGRNCGVLVGGGRFDFSDDPLRLGVGIWHMLAGLWWRVLRWWWGLRQGCGVGLSWGCRGMGEMSEGFKVDFRHSAGVVR